MVEQKQRNPREKWRGVPVILTTNNLPEVMRDPKRKPEEEDYEFYERKDNFGAFKSRCRLTRLERYHRNAEQFPYTADQLALYM